MRTTEQILELLPRLDQSVADELEDQDLDLRQITSFGRTQVKSLMRELREEHPKIRLIGDKKGSRYIYELNMDNP